MVLLITALPDVRAAIRAAPCLQTKWFGAIPLTEPDEDSDRWAVDHNLVSLTPLSLDLTNRGWLNTLRARAVEPATA